MPASRAQRTETAVRRSRAVNMKLAGADYQTIADQLGYASRGAAHTDITRALEASLAQQARDVEVWRHELLLSLNRLKAALWPAAIQGEVKAAEAALKVIDRICKLTGADAPQRVEVLTMGAVEAEIARLSAELGEPSGGVPSEQAGGGLLGGAETQPAT